VPNEASLLYYDWIEGDLSPETKIELSSKIRLDSQFALDFIKECELEVLLQHKVKSFHQNHSRKQRWVWFAAASMVMCGFTLFLYFHIVAQHNPPEKVIAGSAVDTSNGGWLAVQTTKAGDNDLWQASKFLKVLFEKGSLWQIKAGALYLNQGRIIVNNSSNDSQFEVITPTLHIANIDGIAEITCDNCVYKVSLITGKLNVSEINNLNIDKTLTTEGASVQWDSGVGFTETNIRDEIALWAVTPVNSTILLEPSTEILVFEWVVQQLMDDGLLIPHLNLNELQKKQLAQLLKNNFEKVNKKYNYYVGMCDENPALAWQSMRYRPLSPEEMTLRSEMAMVIYGELQEEIELFLDFNTVEKFRKGLSCISTFAREGRTLLNQGVSKSEALAQLAQQFQTQLNRELKI
jgi:hypothetical protein